MNVVLFFFSFLCFALCLAGTGFYNMANARHTNDSRVYFGALFFFLSGGATAVSAMMLFLP